MKYQVIAFVPSEPLAISVSIGIANSGQTDFRLVFTDGAVLSDDVAKFLTDLGAKIEHGNHESADLTNVREVHLHTFATPFAQLAPFVNKCHARGIEIVCYADGLKNEYSIDFLKQSRSHRISFNGWIFDKGGLEDVSVEAVPLRVILNAFQRLRQRQAPPQQRYPSALVILMRYWGLGSYQLKPGISLAEAMFRSIPLNPGAPHDRIFIKADPRISAQTRADFVRYCTEVTASKVLDFSEMAGVDKSKDLLPVEMLWHEPTGAACYSFDSSVSIYLTALGERNILFPNESILSDIFENPEGISAVRNYSNLFKRVCAGIVQVGIDKPLIVNVDPAVRLSLHG